VTYTPSPAQSFDLETNLWYHYYQQQVTSQLLTRKMNEIQSAAAKGLAAFVATNIDDLLVLMLFFAQVNSTFRRQHIIAGQYLGFTILIAMSLPGFFGGLFLPQPWIGLLGLLPILIGLKEITSSDSPKVQTANNPSNLWSPKKIERSQMLMLSPYTYKVAAVTLANGGDNIGIYVPLFASSSWADLGVILSIFFLLVGIWCWFGYQLTRHPAIGQVLTRYSARLMPLILIGLGIFILIENNTLSLLK